MDPQQARGAPTRNELLAVTVIMSVVPSTTSFGFPSDWTYIAPKNCAYHHMLLAVYFAFAGSALTLAYCSKGSPWVSQLALLVLFLLVHTTLWAVNTMWVQAATWAVVLLTLVGVRARHSGRELPHWLITLHVGAFQHWRKRAACPSRLRVLSALFSVLRIGMLSGPTFASWEPVQKFVRWHPYNEDAELIWRGNFFRFAALLRATSTNPVRHSTIVLHGAVMLIDSLRNLDGNGNPEHAVEISFFFSLGVFSAYCARPLLPHPSGHTVVCTEA